MSSILYFYHQDSNQMMGVALLLWASSNRQTTLYFSTLKTVNSRLFSRTNIITSIAGVKRLSLNTCLQKTKQTKKTKILDCLSEYLLLTVLHAETTACRCRILYCLKWSQHVVLWGKITTFVPDNIFSNPPNPPVCPALHAADLSGSEGYIKSSEIQNVKTVDSELRNANGSTGAGFKVHVCWYSKGVRSVYSVWKQIQSGGITLRDHTGFKKKKKANGKWDFINTSNADQPQPDTISFRPGCM